MNFHFPPHWADAPQLQAYAGVFMLHLTLASAALILACVCAACSQRASQEGRKAMVFAALMLVVFSTALTKVVWLRLL